MGITSYRELEVWQRSIALVEAVYILGKRFPPDERFGLTSQLQRAAVSIPANIAEGWGRSHRGDYLHHLSIARGSLMEAETHVTIALRLHYVTEDDTRLIHALSQEVGKMLAALIASLREKS